MLSYSIIGLGFGMNLKVIYEVGKSGVLYTVVGITFTLIAGYLLGKAFKIKSSTTILTSVGTAICGGSAIAAIAPIIRADDDEITISLLLVFLLNGVALFLFPILGHAFDLSQHAFGLFAALAIHDTSSVVAASLSYGKEALEVATTVKLARALWIIPLSMLFLLTFRKINNPESSKIKRPWFILGFVLASAIVTLLPTVQPTGTLIADLSKRVLVLTLFLIGANASKKSFQNIGVRPLFHALTLWILVIFLTLLSIQLLLIK